jgi:hypothetical protein
MTLFVKSRVFSATVLAIGVFPLTSVRCLAGDVAGCYQLQLSPWTPTLSLGEDEIFILPPSKIALTATPGHTWDPHGFKVTPSGGAPQSIHKASYWTRNGHHLRIVWTTGFSGLTMDLRERGSNLEGTARTFWEFSKEDSPECRFIDAPTEQI